MIAEMILPSQIRSGDDGTSTDTPKVRNLNQIWTLTRDLVMCQGPSEIVRKAQTDKTSAKNAW